MVREISTPLVSCQKGLVPVMPGSLHGRTLTSSPSSAFGLTSLRSRRSPSGDGTRP